MKTCQQCGGSFIGLGELCAICTRHPRVVPENHEIHNRVTAVTEKVTSVTQEGHNRDGKRNNRDIESHSRDAEGHSRDAELRAERHKLLERLREINAEIGPMTTAERQQRSRQRKRDSN